MEFTDFLTALKKGERNFFELLESPVALFEDIPFDDLLTFKDDVLRGVNRMQKNAGHFNFDLFDSCLVKHFDNREITWEMFTQTTDAEDVSSIFQDLFDHFGKEITKPNWKSPFFDNKRIAIVAGSKEADNRKVIKEVWRFEKLSFKLQYDPAPCHLFTLSITIVPDRIVDYSIRRKGTILDKLDVDIDFILSAQKPMQPPVPDPKEGGFVDYTYLLVKKQLNLFDKITIRIFGKEQKLSKYVRTHVILGNTAPIGFEDMVRMMDKLVDIYGTDNRGYGELEPREREIMEKLGVWMGRDWTFNKEHALLTEEEDENDDDAFTYEVEFNNVNDNREFKLTILSFNQLVGLFGTA